MENTLQEWATKGYIPVYTSWNKEILSADPAACGKSRPDFTFITNASVIVLEYDEYQHKHEDPRCELKRMANIYLSYRGLPVTFVRYNPDAFKVGGVTLVTKRETREAVLLDVLKASLANTDDSNSIVVHYVCYDIPVGGNHYVQTHRFTDIGAYESWVEATVPA